jgi:hypothetical protein
VFYKVGCKLRRGGGVVYKLLKIMLKILLKIICGLYIYLIITHNQYFIQVTCCGLSAKPSSDMSTYKGYKNGTSYTVQPIRG